MKKFLFTTVTSPQYVICKLSQCRYGSASNSNSTQQLFAQLQQVCKTYHALGSPFSSLKQRLASTYNNGITPIVRDEMTHIKRCANVARNLTVTTNNTILNRRPPTPPMPRKMYETEIEEFEVGRSGTYGHLRLQHDNGNVYIAGGWILMMLFAYEMYLDYKKFGGTSRREELNKEKMINEIVETTKKQRQEMYEQYSNVPTLYQSRVIRRYKMGGSRGLYNVKVDDIIDVVEENVGPRQLYHLCRFTRPPKAKEMNNDVDNDNQEGTKSKMPFYEQLYHLYRFTLLPEAKERNHGNDNQQGTTALKKSKMPLYKDENGDIIELGWYPITHLEKYVPPVPPKKKSWWKRLLFL